MGRYSVSGLPPAASRGTSAFFPNMNRLAASGAQQYKDGITGHPGSPGVAIQSQGLISPDKTAGALKGTADSSNAPWMFYPNKYWALPERNYRPGLQTQVYDPVSPQNTTIIPVPATSLRQHHLRRSAELAAGVSPGGTRQVKLWPKLISWRNRQTGNGTPSG